MTILISFDVCWKTDFLLETPITRAETVSKHITPAECPSTHSVGFGERVSCYDITRMHTRWSVIPRAQADVIITMLSGGMASLEAYMRQLARGWSCAIQDAPLF